MHIFLEYWEWDMRLEPYVCISSQIGTDRVQYRVRGLLDAPDVVDVTEHATHDVHQAHMGTMKQVIKQDLDTQKRAQREEHNQENS